MATYVGPIEYENGFYNFWPQAELIHGEMNLLSEEELNALLPDSYFKNINLKFNHSKFEEQDFLQEFTELNPLYALDIEKGDLYDNVDPHTGEIRSTGYYINAISAVRAKKIRPVQEEDVYQIYPITAEEFRKNSVTIDEEFMCAEEQILLLEYDGYYVGPFPILYRSVDDSFYVRTQFVNSAYQIQGYTPELLHFQSFENGLFASPKGKRLKLDLVSDEDLIGQYEEILGESLLSQDKNFEKYRKRYEGILTPAYLERRLERLKTLVEENEKFKQRERRKEEEKKREKQGNSTAFVHKPKTTSSRFDENPFLKLKDIDFNEAIQELKEEQKTFQIESKPEEDEKHKKAEIVLKVKKVESIKPKEEIVSLPPAPEFDRMNGEEMLSYMIRAIQAERPEYTDNFIIAYLISLFQNRVTFLSGGPGTGKTSLMLLTARVLGSKGEYVHIHKSDKSHKKLYKHNPELIDALRVENLVEHEDRQVYLALFDQAADAPAEHYLSDFYNEKKEIALQGGERIALPEQVRCILSVCVDFYSQVPSPRLLDRSFVFALPESSAFPYRAADPVEKKRFSYEDLSSLFIPEEIQPLSVTEDRVYQRLTLLLKTQNLYISPRKFQNILRFTSTAKKLFRVDNPGLCALDYAIACQILPMINGSGNAYRHFLEKLRDALDGMPVSVHLINNILERGNYRLGSYAYFGRVY